MLIFSHRLMSKKNTHRSSTKIQDVCLCNITISTFNPPPPKKKKFPATPLVIKFFQTLSFVLHLSEEFRLSASPKAIYCSLVRPLLKNASVLWDPCRFFSHRMCSKVFPKPVIIYLLWILITLLKNTNHLWINSVMSLLLVEELRLT